MIVARVSNRAVVLGAAALLTLTACTAPGQPAASSRASTSLASNGAALGCPAKYQLGKPGEPYTGWVPASPTMPTGGQLVPNSTPNEAVVCAYRGAAPLTPARTEVRGDLQLITADLAHIVVRESQHLCLTYLALSDGQNYLIGLRYERGTVWVSVPGNHCLGSTNGRDASPVNLRVPAQQLYRTGYWDSDLAVTARCTAPVTRDSHDRPIVPDDPTGVTICQQFPGDPVRALEYPARDGRLTGVNSLASMITTSEAGLAPVGCTGVTDNGGMLLAFHYANRPDVVLAATPACANHLSVPRAANDFISAIGFFWIDRV